MLKIQAGPMVQGDITKGVRISCGSQTFGIGDAEFSFCISVKPAKGTGLNDPPADGELSCSKLFRRVSFQGIQRISRFTLANQNFCFENAKLVVPNRVGALRTLETLVG